MGTGGRHAQRFWGLVLGWLLLGSTLAATASPPAIQAPPLILIIESYHADYPWDVSFNKGIAAVLGDRYRLIHFHMDTKRLPPRHYEARAELAWQEYLNTRPDLVMLADDNALRFLGPRLAQTTTPVVYLGINNNPRHYGILHAPNITGVLERPRLQDVIWLMEQLLPSRRDIRLLVLLDSGETSSVIVNEVFAGKEEFTLSKIRVTVKRIGHWANWQQQVLQAKEQGYHGLVIGLYHTLLDDAGEHVDSEAVMHWSSQNTPVPPFGFWDFAVGADKTIGGILMMGETQGEEAARIVLEITQGTPPKAIVPRIPEQGRLMFSRSQLEKWQLELNPTLLKRAYYVD